MNRKGIILAGGSGSRLFPITSVISKQLLPVYDKPMIFYPLSTLMLANIREIIIITTEKDNHLFKNLLGNGEQLGISISYLIQPEPEGLAQSFLIAEKLIAGYPTALILGDNLYHGQNLVQLLNQKNSDKQGATIFIYPVRDPERYGVVEFSSDQKVTNIEEKPLKSKSRFAVTGLYFYDESVIEKAKKVKKSSRGEFEITDVNLQYLHEGTLKVAELSRGMVWFDTGTHGSLHNASSYIKTLEERQGLKTCCPEEVAWRMGWIGDEALEALAQPLLKSGYGQYLLQLLKEGNSGVISFE